MTERREFHYNNDDYNKILWRARVFGFDPSHVGRDSLFIHVVSALIKL